MLRLIVALPLIVVLVIFTVQNTLAITITFLVWKTSVSLSVAVLLASAAFFLLGALVVWFGELRQRRRARRAEYRVRELEAQLTEARVTLAPITTAPVHAAPVGALPP